jgi:hypothetical protein
MDTLGGALQTREKMRKIVFNLYAGEAGPKVSSWIPSLGVNYKQEDE